MLTGASSLIFPQSPINAMHRRYLLFLFCCLSLTDCVNLRSVNVFGTAAVAGLQQRATLPATFGGVYQQRVQDDSLSRHPFSRIPVVGIDFANRVRQDSLRSYQLADTLTKTGTTLLATYFTALINLSATGNAFVPVQLKSPTFEQFLQNSALKLKAGEVISFTRIVNLVGAAATGQYRQRQVSNVLDQSYGDVSGLLNVLIYAHQRLAEVVDISREQQYGYYKSVLIHDKTLTYSQKLNLARQWLQTAKSIEQTRQTILTYVQTLSTIRAAYAVLYEKRRQLTRKETLTAIGSYASTLQQLQTDLEQLKPVYGRFHP